MPGPTAGFLKVYTWYIPGMTRHNRVSAFLPIILCSLIGAIILDTMNDAAAPVVEERFVYLACQELNVHSILNTKRALRIQMSKSKNPRCLSEGSDKIRVMTRPGDIISGGLGGMGPCPPLQHQPPGLYDL